MSNISVDYDILNQKQTPAFYASSLATRPAFGFPGRIFIDTDTPSSGIYRDTGSAWVQVADPGAGTTGTLQQVTTNGNTTTLGIQVQGIDINDGAGTGGGNTAIGTSSLSVNTTGSSNTAVGNSSLPANTTGGYNTALGQGTLLKNTTASYNTAIGNTALNNNTTGANNTALGNTSLASNTTASFNTAIGATSLQLNTTGGSNTAVGYQSLNANTTGANNTALGLSALSGNTTASNNTAIGSSSLLNNTTGFSNTGVGQGTLLANTTGNNNVALGQAAVSSNTTGAYNIGIGVSALQNNTTAGNNIAIGSGAMSSNTIGASNIAIGTSTLSANTTASNNTAVGYDSLSANTTGNSNTSLGFQTLKANTTGNTNTAIGFSSLIANTTGAGNIAIGSSSLYTNTTGANNVAIGTGSSYFNTTGSSNTAVGNASLQQNTTGNNNTAVGYSALQINTTGANNTAIGLNSLQNNTTGIDNTAVGLSSLGVNTTGQYNAAFGRSSLNANTIGNFNTAIGSQALANITTGSQNIAIGYNSGGGITTGSSNTIIGTSVTGLPAGLSQNIILADGVGNVRLFSDANGLIGINQAVGSVPGGQLDIHTAQTYALVLNGLTTNNAYTAFSNNSVGKWRIGNTYNAGANTFDIYNLGTSSNALSILNTNNFVGIGTAAPAYKIDLFESGGSFMQLYQNDGTNNRRLIINANATGVDKGITMNATSSVGGDNFIFKQSSVEQYRLSANGNFLIGTSTDDTINKLQVNGSTATTGIKFPATQIPSADVNVLDDYEEGTFTPLLKFGGNSVGMTYFDNIGNYTKIGRQVTVQIYLALTNIGSSTGNATIIDLPFTSGSGNRAFQSVGSIRFDNIIYTGMIDIYVSAVSSSISFEQVSNLGVDSALTNTNFNSSTEMSITLTYFT